jgi:multidrug efflux pump subunit AcrA (membrane-fusion protein)
MSETLTVQPQSKNELLTDEVQEVISYRPHWVVRRGNTVFLLIILLLLALTLIIKYPDIINASARLIALNPPKAIAAKTDGKLLKLFVNNEQQVKKGQHLGYMESTGDYNEVIGLQKWIDQTIAATQNNEHNFLITHPLPGLSNLGELQLNYQSFQNQLEITKQTLTSGYYQKKRVALQKDMQYIATLKNNAGQQKELQEQDQQLQQKEYDAYEKLAKDKVIAPLD